MKAKQTSAILLATLAAVLIAGCGKKQPPPAAPTPPPPAPTASLSANPDAIEAGQSTTLTWQTANATDVSIDALGTVDPNGSRDVTPGQSTTYRLTAKGPGGTQTATARVTVSAPGTGGQEISLSDEQLFARNVKDIFFDYDQYDIRADQRAALAQDAAFLKQHPNWHFTIQGHCDERGSIEYNLTLGSNRSEAVKSALVQAGVNGGNIRTVTFGKEKPFCTESNEACWQENRRGHFVLTK